jgi:mycothiol S-conjugate amidase
METPRSGPLCLLTIHAHPDDESSKGAGSVARYHTEGVRTVLVCCTGGEEGDILNPAMDRDDVRADIGRIRQQELDRAAAIIGYDEVVMLGYRDSGMPDSEANKNPDAFANAPLEEAVDRFVEILRRERPQVVVTYDDEQKFYPHPDHLRVNEITQPAVDAAADPGYKPELGEPWQVSKIYFSVWSKKRILASHEKYVELGLESPFSEEWLARPGQDDRITTSIDLVGYNHIRLDALLAHATQIDPESPFWFGLPREVSESIHPYDDYVLAWTVPGLELPPTSVDAPETDLFAGVRQPANAS